ncbi:hypothetical protein BDV95DRAFT_498199 [Massariosphaeria phaeospora]|uniref:Six-hairpin glycosidase-like protein n=1 Tax=Massariosphaeria phaeospora TaxID=100035 RepID=A0A7C8M6Z9_9PLEO|nr:hypothetical protein BDV95DRAFT_498199 [Massariosphaeria phaeospora]
MLPSPTTLTLVLSQAISLATHSWEYGTAAQALLEWDTPSHSIWNAPFPHGNGKLPTLDVDDVSALKYARPFIRTDRETLVDGDGAAGDPAALGIPALLIGQSTPPYLAAALRQQTHLLTVVPRAPNGAISHRETSVSLWADFIYMVPPFLAYSGVASSDLGLLKEAAQQCAHYADVLGTPPGPWLHIVPGEGAADQTKDLQLWSTGNGWAAAGMARVLATARKSGFDAQTKGEQAMLSEAIKEIVDGTIRLDDDGSVLLRNYVNDTTWFGEVSGTALIAATVLRMAVLMPDMFGAEYTEWAVRKKDVVDGRIDGKTGIVAPAVNPLNWKDRTPFTSGSPEGQAFVILLHAAYRDWKAE